MLKLLCAFAVLFFSLLFAHAAFSQGVMLGGRVGVNLANESWNPDPGTNPNNSGSSLGIHAGFLAGAQCDKWFDDEWALSVQLLYDQKGTTETVQGSSGNFDLGYLEIPILVKANIITGSVRPYLFAGPSIGLLLAASVQTNGQTADIKSYYNSVDFSLVGGAGLAFDISPRITICFDASYTVGLTDIDKNSDGSYGNPAVMSRDIRIAAGVMFPI
jgi:hypothetical protein